MNKEASQAESKTSAVARRNAPPDAAPAPQESRVRLLARLSPAYFGLVMATGIVSLGADMMGPAWLAGLLFVLNVVQYGILCLLFVLRAIRYPRLFFGDMLDHLRAPGYFTTVAGTGILASQFIVQRGDVRIGLLLGVFAAILWLALTYTIFTGFTVKLHKPTLDKGISGGWLLAIVATQSIAVVSTLLAPHVVHAWETSLHFVALSMWLWGGMLYIWMMALIFYRYMYFEFSVDDLLPPYWINMGAMAISTLEGSLLITAAGGQVPLLASLLPFLKGFTVFYWATGTWWIPILLLLGVWRYGFQRFPFRYDPLYWGAVFPLGMYAVCTWQMDHALDLGLLNGLSRVFLYAAILAWGLSFAGMLHGLVRRDAPTRR